MRLVKEDKKIIIEGSIKSNDWIEYVSKLIDYYIAIFSPPDTWLTKRERVFLICCILIGNKNLKYISGEAKHIFNEIFNLSRMSDITAYLDRLEEKNFLKFSKKTKKINLPPFFLMDVESHDLEMNLNFKLEI